MTITRGCGSRVAGGVYAEVGVGVWGHPIQEFYCDPAIHIPDPEGFGLSHVGVTIFPGETSGSGIVSATIMDWVGARDYPYPADVLAEAMFIDPETGLRAGFSRRLPRNLDWASLGSTPLLALVHSRAIVPIERRLKVLDRSWSAHFPELLDRHKANISWAHNFMCPRQIRGEHCQDQPIVGIPATHGMCPALWWADVPELDCSEIHKGDGLLATRSLPGGSYVVLADTPPVANGSYGVGIIARLPVACIAVVNDPDSGTHEIALKKLESAQVRVELVDA